MAIMMWLGAAANVYRIFTQSQKPDGDLFVFIIQDPAVYGNNGRLDAGSAVINGKDVFVFFNLVLHFFLFFPIQINIPLR